MRNYCKTIGAMAAASAIAAGNALAGVTTTVTTSSVEPVAQPAVDANLHVGYTNQYIFRGIDLGSDLVEAGLDVSTEWNGLGLSAGAWYGSFDAAGTNLDELDLYGEVSKDLGFATAHVGYIWYYLFNDAPNAQEVYFSLSREFFGFEAAITYYLGIQGDNDGYSTASLSKSFELTSCLSLSTSAVLGYLVEEGHLAHLTTKVALDYSLTETATLSPFVALSLDLSGGHGDSSSRIVLNNYSDAKNELVGGAMLNVNF